MGYKIIVSLLVILIITASVIIEHLGTYTPSIPTISGRLYTITFITLFLTGMILVPYLLVHKLHENDIKDNRKE
jgi:hypothetical protein